MLLTICERDRGPVLLDVARQFAGLGFGMRATEGTRAFLAGEGVESQHVLKVYEGRPNIADAIKNGEIQLVVNTPAGKLAKTDDSYIRKAAIKHRIPYITTIAAAAAAAKGIEAIQGETTEVKSLQSYHADVG